MSPRWIRPLPAIALAATLATALTACGADDDVQANPGSSGDTAAATSSPSAGATHSAGTKPGGKHTGKAGDRRCHTTDLGISMSGIKGAAGSVYFKVRLRNTSKRSCELHGFGGLSFVDADGKQIGAAAERDSTGGKPKTVTLAPGATAVSRVQQGEAANYPEDKCKPTKATGLRVYPPNETEAKVISYSTDACSIASVSLLQVRPYHLAG